MKLLCTKEEFEQTDSQDYLPLKCKKCGSTFKRRKSGIQSAIDYIVGFNAKTRKTLDYCSPQCSRGGSQDVEPIEDKICVGCGKKFTADKKERWYHSQACFKKHNKNSNSRSKSEELIESLIRQDFPDLELKTNDREFLRCNLEIDLFLPEINTAIEVNGPCHYRPIYGKNHFEKRKKNDRIKTAELKRRDVEFIVLDTSSSGHKTWKKSKQRILLFYENTLKDLIEEAKKRNLATRNQAPMEHS